MATPGDDRGVVLDDPPTSNRMLRLRFAASRRMDGLRIVLDGLEDRGNRAAVLRSAEALGILNVHEVAPANPDQGKARGVANGGEKWLNVHQHANPAECREALKDFALLAALPPVNEVAASASWHSVRSEPRRKKQAAHGLNVNDTAKAEAEAASADAELEADPEADVTPLGSTTHASIAAAMEPTAIESLDFGRPTALVFGNERLGISADMLSKCDGAFHIPLHGLTESLNVSVACAVSMHYGRISRAAALRSHGQLNAHGGDLSEADVQALCDEYSRRGKHHAKKPKG